MTATGASRDRDVLPRWRFLEAAASLGDLEPLRAVQEPGPAQDDLSEQLEAFHDRPGLYTAGDLLSAARAAGLPRREADPAAALVLGWSPLPGEALAQLARLQLEQVDEEPPAGWRAPANSPRESVSQLRRHLRLNPRNPLRWVDLSLAHATLGHHEQATRSMLAALTLAPAHRHVLRSAARLFLLRDDFERAYHVLSSGDVLGDPWLAASLVSVSQLMERPIQRIRDYRDLLTRSGLAPRHLGELASELATVELRAGNDRRARKLLLQAMADPTENALAQVEWAREQGVSLPPTPGRLPPHPFEAGALVAFYGDDYDRALDLGKDWQADQPFDPRPATFVSYVASLGLEDYKTAVRACEIGLLANPTDSMLRNNYVFTLAASGDAQGAEAELRKLPTSSDIPREAAVFEATRGLVAYRAGDPAEGRSHYSKAVALLSRLDDPEIAALVALLWVGEERRVGGGSLYLLEAQSMAERLSARAPSRTVRVVKERVLGAPTVT